MPRLLVAVAFTLALSSAVFLYAVKYETRRLEAEVHARERAIEAARQDIAVMEAERAHLSSPDRIAPLARSLGMGPADPDQMTRRHPAFAPTPEKAPRPAAGDASRSPPERRP